MNPSPYPTPFISAHNRARIVKILLIAGGVTSGMFLFVEPLSLAFPLTEDQELGDSLMGTAVILIMLLLAVLDSTIYLTTVIFFLVWLFRVYDNLRAFNPSRRLNYSTGWAVASFFIPLVNLVVPYRAVKEVWQKSGPPDEAFLYEPSAPVWFPVWWLFWLLASFANNISTRINFNESTSESTAMIMSLVASALSVVAAVFAYSVVDAIDQRQEETSGKLGLRQFSGPPPPPANLSMPDVVAPTT